MVDAQLGDAGELIALGELGFAGVQSFFEFLRASIGAADQMIVVSGLTVSERVRHLCTEAHLAFGDVLLTSATFGASTGGSLDDVGQAPDGSRSSWQGQARRTGSYWGSAKGAPTHAMNVCAPLRGVSSPTKRRPRWPGHSPSRAASPSPSEASM